jgi:large subunit ribosomal protein L7e
MDTNIVQPPITKITEHVIKKKRSFRAMNIEKEERKLKRLERRKQLLENRPKSIKYKSPEEFVREYRRLRTQDLRIKKLKYRQNELTIDSELHGKPVFVLRIRGNPGLTPEIRRILKSFRLFHKRWGVFIKYNEKNAFKLKLIEPFVTYGFPSDQIIRDLIMKKGHTLDEGKLVPITDNVLIEKKLGDVNVVCTEDIVYEITKCGTNFVKVNKFLRPFKFVFRKRFAKTRTRYKDGGDSGNRRTEITQLLEKLI